MIDGIVAIALYFSQMVWCAICLKWDARYAHDWDDCYMPYIR